MIYDFGRCPLDAHIEEHHVNNPSLWIDEDFFGTTFDKLDSMFEQGKLVGMCADEIIELGQQIDKGEL